MKNMIISTITLFSIVGGVLLFEDRYQNKTDAGSTHVHIEKIVEVSQYESTIQQEQGVNDFRLEYYADQQRLLNEKSDQGTITEPEQNRLEYYNKSLEKIQDRQLQLQDRLLDYTR